MHIYIFHGENLSYEKIDWICERVWDWKDQNSSAKKKGSKWWNHLRYSLIGLIDSFLSCVLKISRRGTYTNGQQLSTCYSTTTTTTTTTKKKGSLQHASCMCLYVCAKTAWLWLIYNNDHFNSIKCDSHKSPIPTNP